MICLATMVATVTGAAVLAAGPAVAAPSASDAWAYCEWAGESCGYAYFTSEVGDGTERLSISDQFADGWGVAVENYRYDLANIGPYWGWNRIPSPSTVNYTLHITEGARFEFRVCAEYKGIVLTAYCSPWANGYA
jgi:hypothetical protein